MKPMIFLCLIIFLFFGIFFLNLIILYMIIDFTKIILQKRFLDGQFCQLTIKVTSFNSDSSQQVVFFKKVSICSSICVETSFSFEQLTPHFTNICYVSIKRCWIDIYGHYGSSGSMLRMKIHSPSFRNLLVQYIGM